MCKTILIITLRHSSGNEFHMIVLGGDELCSGFNFVHVSHFENREDVLERSLTSNVTWVFNNFVVDTISKEWTKSLSEGCATAISFLFIYLFIYLFILCVHLDIYSVSSRV